MKPSESHAFLYVVAELKQHGGDALPPDPGHTFVFEDDPFDPKYDNDYHATIKGTCSQCKQPYEFYVWRWRLASEFQNFYAGLPREYHPTYKPCTGEK